MKNGDFIREIIKFETEINSLYLERQILQKERKLTLENCEAEREKARKQIDHEAALKNENCRTQYYQQLDDLNKLKQELKDCEESLGKVKNKAPDTQITFDKGKLDDLLQKIGDSSLAATIQKIFRMNGYFSNRKMKQTSYQMIQEGIEQTDEKIKKAAEKCNNRLAAVQQEKKIKQDQNRIFYDNKVRKIHTSYRAKADNLENKRRALWSGSMPVRLRDMIRQTGKKAGLDMSIWEVFKAPKQKEEEVALGWMYCPLTIPREEMAEIENRFPGFYTKERIRFPFLIPYHNSFTLYLEFSEEGRDRALDGVRYLMLQLIRTIPLQEYHISFLDPLERGTGIERLQKLTESMGCDICYDAVCSVEDGLKHISKLQEKYDRQYAPKLAGKGNIDEYNRLGKEQLDYQIIVINDIEEFRENPFYKALGTMLENAEKFGTSVVILNNRSRGEELERNRGENKEWNIFLNMYERRFHSLIWKEDTFWDRETGKKVQLSKASKISDKYIESIADYYKKGQNVDNSFLKYICCDEKKIQLRDPYNKNYIRIPFAIDRNRQIHELELGSELNTHAMVVGGTGAGKSFTLHAIVASLAVHYHPDDVEIWLLDFKFAEMKKYKGVCWLPHIRLIGMDSEDSFAVGILKKLESELMRRKKLITGDIHDYEAKRREAIQRGEEPKEKLPHIVVILDEYQRLIQAVNGTDDRIIVENLLRESRALGMYFVFSSQSSTGLLKDNEMKQIAGRMFMHFGSGENEEKMTFFDMVKGEEKERLDELSRNLGPGAMVYRSTEKVSAGVSSNSYARVSALFLPPNVQEKLLPKIAGMKIFDGHLPKRTLCYEGRQRREMNTRQIIEDEKSLGYCKGIDPDNPNDRILYLGTPVGPDFYTRIRLVKSKNDHIMMVGRNRKLQYAVLMSLIKSYLRKTGEIWIVADEYNPLYTEYQKELEVLSTRKHNVHILDKMPEICGKIHEWKEQVTRKEREEILLVILGLSDLMETMTGYSKAYEPKSPPFIQESVKSAENGELSQSDSKNNDLEERRKRLLEAIEEQYGKESERKARELEKTSPAGIISADHSVRIGISDNDGTYNATGDMRDSILGKGALFGIHAIVTADTYSEVKGGEMRGCLERCRHRIGCGLTKEECGSLLENMKAGNMLDDSTCAYYDGSGISYFLPFTL